MAGNPQLARPLLDEPQTYCAWEHPRKRNGDECEGESISCRSLQFE
jgi:hypothetical protein